MKYAVMFEPFDGLEYVCKPKKDYQLSGDEPMLFNNKYKNINMRPSVSGGLFFVLFFKGD